jgi:argininosuccinate synthase
MPTFSTTKKEKKSYYNLKRRISWSKRRTDKPLYRNFRKAHNAYAIGRDTHVGDTIIGIKGRVGFEAAAP